MHGAAAYRVAVARQELVRHLHLDLARRPALRPGEPDGTHGPVGRATVGACVGVGVGA